MDKESTLWNTQELREDIILTKGKTQDIKFYASYFNESLTVNELKNFFNEIKNWLVGKNAVRINEKQQTVNFEEINSFFVLKKPLKKDYVKFFSHFFASTSNVSLLIHSYSKSFQNLLKETLQADFVTLKRFCSTKEGKNLLSKENYWEEYYQSNSPWFKCYAFSETTSSRTYMTNHYVSVNPVFYHFAYQVLCQEEPILHVNLDDEKELKVLLTEKSMTEEYPFIKSLYEQRLFAPGKNGNFLFSQLKKYGNMLNLEEFFPLSEEKKVANYHSVLTLPFLYHIFCINERTKDRKSLETILYDAFNINNFDADTIIPSLLPHLKNVKSEDLEISAFDQFLENNAIVFKRLYKKGKWISVDTYLNQMRSMPLSWKSFHFFYFYDYYHIKLKNSKMNDETLTIPFYQKDVCEAFLKNWLFLLGSIGIFDLAYRDFNENDRYWTEGLSYVRPTNLGAYVFNCCNKYQPDFVIEKKQYFEIDDQMLIVRSLETNNPYESFLNDIGKYIGNQRYAITYDSFLKNCNSEKEVEHKISCFKQFISSKYSKVWEDFFDTMTKRFHPLNTIKNTNYIIFNINPKDKELMHLLNTDSELKQYAIRAEHYLILVKKEDFSLFSERLKHFGFML